MSGLDATMFSSRQGSESRPATSGAWRTFPGARVTIWARAGSEAARRGATEQRLAERAIDELARLLERPRERATDRIDLVLADDPAQASDSPVASGNAVVVPHYAADEPIRWLEPLTERLLNDWCGAAAAGAAVFIRGLASLVAARLDAGPSVAEAHGWVRGQLLAGQPIRATPQPPLARDAGALDEEAEAERRLAAVSFVDFVLTRVGGQAVARFLTSYDPKRRDHAARAAFRQPLGVLNEMWATRLRRRQSGTETSTFFRHVRPLYAEQRRRLIGLGSYMLLGATLGLALPHASRLLIDRVIVPQRPELLPEFVLALMGISLLNVFVTYRRLRLASYIHEQAMARLQGMMHAHIQTLSHSYYLRANMGDLIARFGDDIASISAMLQAVTQNAGFQVLQAIGAAAYIFALDWRIGLAVVSVLSVSAAPYPLFRARADAASAEQRVRTAELWTALEEGLAAQAVIKAFSLERRVTAEFRQRLQAKFDAAMRLTSLILIFTMITGLALMTAQVIAFAAVGYMQTSGDATRALRDLVPLVMVLPLLFGPVTGLSEAGQAARRAAGSVGRVCELLAEPVGVREADNAIGLPPLQRSIQLRDVRYSFDGKDEVLCGVSAEISAGSNVAIVGPSGAGKSTLAHMLLRFWDPTEGRVLFDGHDLRDCTVSSVRRQIGLVEQQTSVFNTTIRDNIAIGSEHATDADVVAAARTAQLHEAIEALPDGYDTVIGVRGVRLSGGQRQRLAIARALLHDPRIVILDEATSALDAESEGSLLDALAKLSLGRTTITVTHRLSIAALADQILVLREGRIVEHGAHDDLVLAGGLYQRLFEEQTGSVFRRRTRRGVVEVARLQAIPLFATLEREALELLADQISVERFAGEAEVVREGEAGDKLFVVAFGQCEAVVGEDDGERRLGLLVEGDYFGEMALLTGEPRSATVRTTRPTQLYSLSREEFEGLLAAQPELRAAVQETMTRRRAQLEADAAAG